MYKVWMGQQIYCIVIGYNFVVISYGPQRDKTGLPGFGNNIGTDQPAYLGRLVSAFVIRLLESIISKLTS